MQHHRRRRCRRHRQSDQEFFGDVKGKRCLFTNGLDSAALKHIETIQVLRT